MEEDACGYWAKWVATLAICGFIVNFAYGWGGMAWVYCAEMFPMRHRTKGVGATTDANWIGNVPVSDSSFLARVHMATCLYVYNSIYLYIYSSIQI